MRKIKFKAKQKNNGEWVYGYYLQKIDVFGKTEHFIYKCESCNKWSYNLICPETLCEFTGFTDCNGVEIYENDLLGHRLNVVEMMNGVWCVNGDRRLNSMVKNSKVLGNYYDDFIIYD